jgi:hypothetical protein
VLTSRNEKKSRHLLQHFQATLNNKNIKLFTIGCRLPGKYHKPSNPAKAASFFSLSHVKKTPKKENIKERKKNCHDLLGWVRDVALARHKYTHQDYDLFFMKHLFLLGSEDKIDLYNHLHLFSFKQIKRRNFGYDEFPTHFNRFEKRFLEGKYFSPDNGAFNFPFAFLTSPAPFLQY